MAVASSNLSVKDLFNLAIHYWVNRALDITLNLEKDMSNFLKVIGLLVRLANKEGILFDSEDGDVCPFWENIRQNLADNSRPFPALMAAMLCKHVMLKNDKECAEDNGIEVLSQENVKWSLLIG